MMDDPKIGPGDAVSEVVPVQDARAAEKTGRVRVILIVSFALAVICLGAIVIGFAGGA
ncbi:MAG TPA: hypothetical protein VGM59_17165 [Dongiaceae bacterium]|jgi:hypothetical protein